MLENNFISLLENHVDELKHEFKEEENKFVLTLNEKKIEFKKASSKFQVKPNHWLRSKHENNKVHEPGLIGALSLLSTIIKKNTLFYDVGALFGYHSHIIASLFDNCECILIEGNPITSEASSHIAKNQRFQLVNSVVGQDDFSKWYYVDVYNFYPAISMRAVKKIFEGSLKNVVKFLLNRIGKNYTYSFLGYFKKLPTTSIPTLLQKKDGEQIIFKVDAEGHQFSFLMPYIKLLSETSSILLIELDDKKKMASLGASNVELVKEFKKFDFKVFWLDHRNPDGIFLVDSFKPWMDRNSLVVCIPCKLFEKL